jgi:predicted secreted protein
MSRTIFNIAVILIPLLSLNACKQGTPKTVTVMEKDSGGTVKIHLGDVLEVNLIGNPSTGFMWEQQSLDSTIVNAKGETAFKPDHEEPGFAGSPGRFTMRYEAVKRGQTDLLLVYHRPWEKSTPPAQTFRMTVKVK